MKKTILVLMLFMCAFLPRGMAQDQHFSQIFASPMTLNPALAGAFDGLYRMSFIYRDQWRNTLEDPYRTFSGAVDFRWGMNFLKRRQTKDAIGAGVLFYNDRAGNSNLTTNQINLLLSYHKSLNRENNQFLTLGIQGGLSQRSINYENTTFGDQFNGTNSYSEPTAELFPENNFGFADLSVGLNYTLAPRNGLSLYAGGAIHHLLEPQMSFFATRGENEGSPLEIRDNRLLRKYTAHVSLSVPAGSNVRVHPRFLFYSQGPHLAMVGGSNLRFLLNEINGVAIHFGGWVRPVKGFDQKIDLDAAIIMGGLEFNNFLVGVSYDLTFSQLNLGRRSQGALEISIAYLGQYENETVLCPKF